jgi:ferredoxin-type protein NapG
MSDEGISRRGLVGGVVGAAALVAIGGTAKAFAGEDEFLRPPGGQNEARFLATCIRCDRCRSACPLDAVTVANEESFINSRTPKLTFRKGYCNFCNLCIENCPTQALEPFNPDTDWIGPAVIEPQLCIAFAKAGGCRICVDACPYDAITLNGAQEPVIDLVKCNGCGYCEYICPSNTFRSFKGSNKRGVNIERTEEKRP